MAITNSITIIYGIDGNTMIRCNGIKLTITNYVFVSKLENLSTDGDVSTRSPNLTLAECDNLLHPKVDHVISLTHGPLMPICSAIGSFIFETSRSEDW